MNTQNHVLVIDNDLETCKEIKYNLDCYYCLTEQEGIKRLLKQTCELVILNVSIPETDSLMIPMEKRQAALDGKILNLAQREFNTLAMLAENPGQVFTFEQLYERLWADEYDGDKNSVQCQMKRLRKKLNGAEFIEAVRDVGYRMKP